MNAPTIQQPMKYATAQKRAQKIVEWLEPYCERLMVAGSIRRERPLCNDIDIVCIPKFSTKADGLFDSKRVNLVREFLCHYVTHCAASTAPHWKGRDGKPAPEPKEEAQNLLLITAAGVQLDVWCASRETWTTRLICRTGSQQHNIWACDRAKALHGHWQPYEGLRTHGQDVKLEREQDFYEALGVPYVEPKDREANFLNRLWM